MKVKNNMKESLVINLLSSTEPNRVLVNGLIFWVMRGMINYKLLQYSDVVSMSSTEIIKDFAVACTL